MKRCLAPVESVRNTPIEPSPWSAPQRPGPRVPPSETDPDAVYGEPRSVPWHSSAVPTPANCPELSLDACSAGAKWTVMVIVHETDVAASAGVAMTHGKHAANALDVASP